MATRDSSREMMAIGFAVLLVSVGAGVSAAASSFTLLLSFGGVVAGVVLVFVGVARKVAAAADDNPTAPTDYPSGVRRWLRRNLAVVGLLLASSASTATAAAAAAERRTNPVLCFCAFGLLLLGLCLINIGVLLLDDEQEI